MTIRRTLGSSAEVINHSLYKLLININKLLIFYIYYNKNKKKKEKEKCAVARIRTRALCKNVN